MQYSRHLTSPLTAVKVSPLRTYGVHTSREIPPDTWFRPLAIGLCDRFGSLSLRGGTTKQSQKLTGLCDYFAPLSLRS
ncbi:MAG: hypothetical protein V7K26_30130 [Nostoc sp.]|uniref:hypothetical protein n=1 Tax=Nostoc sp. TaxID=1180 RepID=UPI002FFC5ED0